MKASSSSRGERGFTLIELLIVIIVIGILAAIAVPVYASQRDKAKDAAVKEGVHFIQEAVVSYAVDHNGAYPATEYVTFTPGDKTADNLGNRYLDPWPRNPWTGKPMANTGSLILFQTDFTSMAGLSSIQNVWKVANGVLVPPTAGGRLAFGNTAWTDVQVNVSATLVHGSTAGYGVYFRSDGQPNITGYCFQFDPGAGNMFTVRKVVAGAEQGAFQKVAMPAGFDIYAPHAISVSAVGSHIVIKVDGATVLDFYDSTYASGSAGLRTWGTGTQVDFTGLQASGAGGTAGSGASNKGDFAYAYATGAASFGLVGWMSGTNAFVMQAPQ